MASSLPARWLVDGSNPTVLDSVPAHLCALCSYAAYYSFAPDVFVNSLGATSLNSIKISGGAFIPQGFLFQLPECNVVVFGGSTNYQQLYSYLRTPYYLRPMYCDPLTLGWYYSTNAANQITALWDDQLRGLLNKAPTFFTGHSLGGAIAASVMASNIAHYPTTTYPRILYTFGAPRAGNRHFADQLAHSYDVMQPGDIVPLLPPSSLICPPNPALDPPTIGVPLWSPFYPHGQPVFLTEGGDLTAVPIGTLMGNATQSVEWDAIKTAVADSPLLQLLGVGKSVSKSFADAMENHQMESYLKRLQKAIPSAGSSKPTAYQDMTDTEAATGGDGGDFGVVIQPTNNVPPLLEDNGVAPLPKRRRH